MPPPLLAIILTLSRLTEVRAHLTATALSDTPDLTAASLTRIVTVTIWVAVAALVVPIIIEVVLALVMVNRGNWARFVLPPVGLLALPAAVIAFEALSDETALTNHSNMIIGISVQAALVLIATVLMFVPSAARWFRTRPRKPPRRVPSARR